MAQTFEQVRNNYDYAARNSLRDITASLHARYKVATNLHNKYQQISHDKSPG